jgi:RNA polymerase sigma-70 factor (ECF subfamily)
MARTPGARSERSQSPASLRKLADEELMALVAAGNPAAFEIVLERHLDAAYSLAYRIVGRRSLAEDIVQEALLSLWRSGARYDPTRGSVRNWTLGIVHHRAIDVLRRIGPGESRRADDDDLAERLPAPEHTELEVTRREDALELRAALTALPSEQSRVIELAYYGGFTHVEIASMLDVPLGTVKGRMRLGLEKMREHLRGQEALG